MSKQDEVSIPLCPAIPSEQLRETTTYFHKGSYLFPLEYTGWRDETMAWKESAYFGAMLNPMPTSRVNGPDALKLFRDVCVNSFENFAVGTGKHAIMCNEEGLVFRDGVLIRTAEDEFYTYEIFPADAYFLSKGSYDAACENLTGKVFLFQIAGPRSLEILEKASGKDLHDIKFMHHRMSEIAGNNVRVLRVGMAGTLAYEVHGSIEFSHEVYNAIWNTGGPLGMRKLGQVAYMMNHTEDGFPQGYYHFPYPWAEDEGYIQFMAENRVERPGASVDLSGSMGNDIRLRYRNPVELGWAGMIKFDHDFTGRKVLEKEVADPKQQMVTLVWNKDDILDIYASQFQPGEPYADMDRPNDIYYAPRHIYHADRVLNKNGDVIGISSGRANSYYYREIISLCSIDTSYAQLGTEVYVLWGNPGKRQKKVRAVVSRFPYLNEGRNETFDVETIPHFGTK
jgi:glycine cleavage system aminomethyltransferase T